MHGRLGFRILHEGVHHQACAIVLGHHHGDAEIDPEDVGVVPAAEGVERVDVTEEAQALVP